MTAPEVYADASPARNSATPGDVVGGRSARERDHVGADAPGPVFGRRSACVSAIEARRSAARSGRGSRARSRRPATERRRRVDDRAAVDRRACAGSRRGTPRRWPRGWSRSWRPTSLRSCRPAAPTSGSRRCCRARRAGRKVSTAAAIIASQSVRRDTSACTAMARPPSFSMRSTVSSRAVVVHVDDDDRGAVLGEQLRRGSALARCRAGDQRDLAGELPGRRARPPSRRHGGRP